MITPSSSASPHGDASTSITVFSPFLLDCVWALLCSLGCRRASDLCSLEAAPHMVVFLMCLCWGQLSSAPSFHNLELPNIPIYNFLISVNFCSSQSSFTFCNNQTLRQKFTISKAPQTIGSLYSPDGSQALYLRLSPDALKNTIDSMQPQLDPSDYAAGDEYDISMYSNVHVVFSLSIKNMP